MLASLLPGVRMLRAPLAAGVLLLTATYIAVVNLGSVSITADAGPGLTRIRDELHNGWVVPASVVAYLTGSMYLAVHRQLIRNMNAMMIEHVSKREYSDPEHEQALWEAIGAPLSRPSLRRLSRTKDTERSDDEVRMICLDIIFGGGRRLLMSHKDLWIEYDRLRAEAEFRDACALPGLLLLNAIVWESDVGMGWQVVLVLLGLLAGVLLFREARAHDREAASLHAHAVADGVVSTAFIDDPDNSGRGRKRKRAGWRDRNRAHSDPA